MKYRWIVPILSIVALIWLWYPTTAPADYPTVIYQDSTVVPEEATDSVYFIIEEPRYIQHIEPAPSIFDWTKEIMTFVLGLGNIIVLLRRKNATN